MHILSWRRRVVIVEGVVVLRPRTCLKNERPWAVVGPVDVPGMLRRKDTKTMECVSSSSVGGPWRHLKEAAETPAAIGGWRLGWTS